MNADVKSPNLRRETLHLAIGKLVGGRYDRARIAAVLAGRKHSSMHDLNLVRFSQVPLRQFSLLPYLKGH